MKLKVGDIYNVADVCCMLSWDCTFLGFAKAREINLECKHRSPYINDTEFMIFERMHDGYFYLVEARTKRKYAKNEIEIYFQAIKAATKIKDLGKSNVKFQEYSL